MAIASAQLPAGTGVGVAFTTSALTCGCGAGSGVAGGSTVGSVCGFASTAFATGAATTSDLLRCSCGLVSCATCRGGTCVNTTARTATIVYSNNRLRINRLRLDQSGVPLVVRWIDRGLLPPCKYRIHLVADCCAFCFLNACQPIRSTAHWVAYVRCQSSGVTASPSKQKDRRNTGLIVCVNALPALETLLVATRSGLSPPAFYRVGI